MATRLVIVRHAHRDTFERSLDNGISEKGTKQVQDLVKDLEKGRLPKGSRFLTSPKSRCRETLEPLAMLCEKSIEVENRLDEQRDSESTRDFIKRLIEFSEALEGLNGVVYICSHGDVIPELTELLLSKSFALKKAEALQLEFKNGKWVTS